MPTFLLEGDTREQSAIEDALRAIIPNLTNASSLDAILSLGVKADRGDPTIVLVSVPQGDHSYFDHLIEIAGRYGSECFLILIGDEISASDYKRLIRSGGADWTSAKANLSEVVDIIARRKISESDTNSAALRSGGSRCVTISFVPCAGGVGNTTLIVETAAYLKTNKSTRNRKICLVDLDFQSSHMCDYLDSEPRLQITDFSSAPERLDERLFESFRTGHSSGIDIFAAPRSKFSMGELNINALDALLSIITRRYELVFIDYPVTWFPWTAQIISASDGAIITGINSIPCLRQLSETLSLVRSGSPPALQIGIVINRCERTFLGSILRQKHVEMALRDERLFFVGNRPEATESANMGVPMMLSASAAAKIRKDFAPLGTFCSELVSRRVVPI
jgi:pilus assembly protein CpaE